MNQVSSAGITDQGAERPSQGAETRAADPENEVCTHTNEISSISAQPDVDDDDEYEVPFLTAPIPAEDWIPSDELSQLTQLIPQDDQHSGADDEDEMDLTCRPNP